MIKLGVRGLRHAPRTSLLGLPRYRRIFGVFLALFLPLTFLLSMNHRYFTFTLDPGAWVLPLVVPDDRVNETLTAGPAR